MVRRGSLKLSHWHLPLQLRPAGPKGYSTQEEDLCGGQDETAVASATNSEAERGDGQKRWDRAYLLILEISQTLKQEQRKAFEEVNHASSDICPGIDPEPGPRSND